jgi:hypothetical protein
MMLPNERPMKTRGDASDKTSRSRSCTWASSSSRWYRRTCTRSPRSKSFPATPNLRSSWLAKRATGAGSFIPFRAASFVNRLRGVNDLSSHSPQELKRVRIDAFEHLGRVRSANPTRGGRWRVAGPQPSTFRAWLRELADLDQFEAEPSISARTP